MAKREEEVFTINPGVVGTTHGFIGDGLIAPHDINGVGIAELKADTADDSVTLVFDTGLPAGVTAVGLIIYEADGTYVAVALTTLDQITWTGTDADATVVLSTYATPIVKVDYTDANATAPLGEDVEPECVRVGTPVSTGTAIPRLITGTDQPDYSTGIDTYYPAAGSTNEVGGGCR
mgnify:CR=1 FL=1